jgi:hypothetical protein
MTFHPTDDQSIRTLLCLLSALLDSKFSQLPERLHSSYAFAPLHSQTTSSNSDDFFMQISEYYKVGIFNLVRNFQSISEISGTFIC